jgi:predicted membrane GTPase involved in stress response
MISNLATHEPAIQADPPTFRINDGPFAGREGKKDT